MAGPPLEDLRRLAGRDRQILDSVGEPRAGTEAEAYAQYWARGREKESKQEFADAAKLYDAAIRWLPHDPALRAPPYRHTVEVWAKAGHFEGTCRAQERARWAEPAGAVSTALGNLQPKLARFTVDPAIVWVDETQDGYAFSTFARHRGQTTWLPRDVMSNWQELHGVVGQVDKPRTLFPDQRKAIQALAVAAFRELPKQVRQALIGHRYVFLLTCPKTLGFPFELLMPRNGAPLGESTILTRAGTLRSVADCLVRNPCRRSAHVIDGTDHEIRLDGLSAFLRAAAQALQITERVDAGLIVAAAHGHTEYLEVGRIRFRPDDLFGLLASPIVLLLSCRAGAGVPDALGGSYRGFPIQTLENGASSFVGCSCSLADPIGASFGADVIEALSHGADVGHAVRSARRAARIRNQNDFMTWHGLTLWGNPFAKLPAEGR